MGLSRQRADGTKVQVISRLGGLEEGGGDCWSRESVWLERVWLVESLVWP